MFSKTYDLRDTVCEYKYVSFIKLFNQTKLIHLNPHDIVCVTANSLAYTHIHTNIHTYKNSASGPIRFACIYFGLFPEYRF